MNIMVSVVDLNREMKKTGVDIHVNTVKRRLLEVGQRAHWLTKKRTAYSINVQETFTMG